jgi:3-mercaptopyruvate sulfurtransferase SseA
MAGISPWIWSGIFLLILTAVLTVWFLLTQHVPTALTAAEARAAIKSHSVSVIIDVRPLQQSWRVHNSSHREEIRTGDEWSVGHYPNARHIPIQNLISQLPHNIKDHSLGILFYCSTGRRAAAAARVAQELGYQNTYYLNSADWQALMPRHRFQEA